jgi:phosphoglucomutase
MISPLAGKIAPQELLEDIATLRALYFSGPRSISAGLEPVSFGTSGHRGTSLKNSFNEAHIVAITTGIIEYRSAQGITGPIYVGKDTHALSVFAEETVLAVLAAHGVEALVANDGGFTPTPAVSHAILRHNRSSPAAQADGIIITPSHNPPADGGLKYNPPHGGPADTDATNVIQKRANELLQKECTAPRPVSTASIKPFDFVGRYVDDLCEVVNIEAIRLRGIRLGVHPLGGAALPYWLAIKERYQLDITIIDSTLDPTFAFVPVDHDGKIRMDCSSPYVMAGLVELRNTFAIAVGTDPDADRHGIVVPSVGLLNPNHYLAVAIRYLLQHRPGWSTTAKVGKTLVSSAVIDRVVKSLGREVLEVPVGFKWFVPGLLSGDLVFGGEESAGASFLCFDGTPWSTDKDGILLCLLAAEIAAVTGKDPGDHYREIVAELGNPTYTRVDRPATKEQKEKLKGLNSDNVQIPQLAGDAVRAVLTNALGNGAAIGGIKVVSDNGWFAVRPSGTEDICKLYAESFKGKEHLEEIIEAGTELLTPDQT